MSECQATASEYFCLLLVGSYDAAKVTEITLDRANGNPCQRHCRVIASEYNCGIINGSRLTFEVVDRILDRANGKPCQTQCRAMDVNRR